MQQQPNNSFKQLYEMYLTIPLSTRIIVTGTILTTLSCHFKIVDPYKVLLDWKSVKVNYEVWRLVTNYFFHSVSIGFLFEMIYLYKNSKELELVHYSACPAQYFMFLVYVFVTGLASSMFLELPALSQTLTMAVLSLWANKNKNTPISIWGFNAKGMYLPWVFIGIEFLLSGGNLPKTGLLGIGLTYSYTYIMDYLARNNNTSSCLVSPPQFLTRIFAPVTANPYGSAFTMQPPNTQQSTAQGARSWGRGRRLGD